MSAGRVGSKSLAWPKALIWPFFGSRGAVDIATLILIYVLLGLIEALGTGYLGAATNGVFGSNYQDVFAFIVLIAVLVFRPSGLLGERLATRA